MARNKELNDVMKEQRIEKIHSVSLKLFASRGLAATKITHIAEAAGMSQGLLYHYYKSKEEIFTELIRTAFAKLNHACNELDKLDTSAKNKIEMAIEALTSDFSENELFGYYHILIAQATMSDSTPKEAKSIISRNNKTPYKIFTKVFEQGQKEGTVINRPAEELSTLFWTTIKGLALHKATFSKRINLPSADLIKTIFLK